MDGEGRGLGVWDAKSSPCRAVEGGRDGGVPRRQRGRTLGTPYPRTDPRRMGRGLGKGRGLGPEIGARDDGGTGVALYGSCPGTGRRGGKRIPMSGVTVVRKRGVPCHSRHRDPLTPSCPRPPGSLWTTCCRDSDPVRRGVGHRYWERRVAPTEVHLSRSGSPTGRGEHE